MARDSVTSNCLLSTYYGQGTVHKFLLSFFLEQISRNFPSTDKHLPFLIPGWTGCRFINLTISAELTLGT